MDRDFINKKRDAAFQIKLDKEGGNIMDFRAAYLCAST